jgi:hypothetical protein
MLFRGATGPPTHRAEVAVQQRVPANAGVTSGDRAVVGSQVCRTTSYQPLAYIRG